MTLNKIFFGISAKEIPLTSELPVVLVHYLSEEESSDPNDRLAVRVCQTKLKPPN